MLLEAFTLTFLAEWGDRSQIATIGAPRFVPVLGAKPAEVVWQPRAALRLLNAHLVLPL